MKKHLIIFLLLLINSILLTSTLPLFPSTSDQKEQEIITKKQSKTSSLLDTAKLLLSDITTTTITPATVTITTPLTTTASLSILSKEDPNACPETDYRIPIERFAQLISTHWHFDHLDSIKTKTYKIISEQFQKHISISIIESNSQSLQQKAFIQPSSSWDMMDLEILYAQIFGAIQAHTEGSLHLAWDRLADTLGQPALESHIKQIVSNYCGGLDHDALGAFCLKQNATQLSTDFYNYIESQLIEVFRTLDNNVLPQLLLDISKDLLDVLDYFNRLFSLNDNQQLYLQVTPWSHNDVFVKSKLMPLLEKSTLNDNHLSEFFSNYACLSRT